MNDILTEVLRYSWIVALILCIIGYKFVLRVFFGMIVIPNNMIGIVTKNFVIFGNNRSLPDGSIIALKGEAGTQADTLAPGVRFGYWPWQYSIRMEKFYTVPEDKIGIVEAKDGAPLADGKVLCKKVDCDSFQNARAFLEKGGERGPQITIIPPGTYRINTSLFVLDLAEVTEIEDNKVGVVTTSEGKPLDSKAGDIAGSEIPGHNSFQDAHTFITNGGYKGLQEQVILAGRYFINPRFATIEIRDMSIVPIASVGVVISYVGSKGIDVTGESFKHGNLVSEGQKGVVVEPKDPGKYPINPHTHKIEVVPTANVVLNWATGKSEAHKLDEKLSTITVRSSDGFTFNLDVSQIIHIPRVDAPKVIARFGSVSAMVTQVLEPTIGNYFRNAAQGSDVIDFLSTRKERQEDAKEKIAKALAEYNVVAVDTLIGDIVPPAELMKTLTSRKIAEQENITYKTQQTTEVTRKELEQAKAQANTQAKVVDAERQVQIAEFTAQASVKSAKGLAESKTINAKADAEVTTMQATAEANKTTIIGEAQGKSIAAVGNAEAEVIQKKTNAVGQGNYAMIEMFKSLANNKIKLVPDIIAGGSGSNGSDGSLVNVLLAGIVKDNMNKGNNGNGTAETVQAVTKK